MKNTITMIQPDRKDDWIATFGGMLGGVSSIKVWLLQAQTNQVFTLMEDWAFKVIGTCILAIVGGCVGLLGKDIYRFKIKPRLFKNNKEDK